MKRTCLLVTVTTALICASACTDDEGQDAAGDAAADASSADAAADAGERDAGFVGMDAARPDAAVQLDAAADAAADAQRADAASNADAQLAQPGADASVASGSGLDGGMQIEVQGRYTSNFGELEVIDATQWGFVRLVEFDNTTRVAITQNPASDMYNPNKFNRYVWTPKSQDGSFYYCTVEFGLQTVELARASTKVADATAPMTTGCGGFAWTKLTPAP